MMISFKSLLKFLYIAVLGLFISACSSSGNDDLIGFMDQVRADSANRIRIDPLPAYPPYVAVIYGSAGFRSPFEPPREIVVSEVTGIETEAPDFSRPKEFLERFNLAELTMVGTIEKDGTNWALIKDASSSVHRVKQGNFLGRNYGLILEVRETGLDLVETVLNGQGGWIERPRSMNMGTNRE